MKKIRRSLSAIAFGLLHPRWWTLKPSPYPTKKLWGSVFVWCQAVFFGVYAVAGHAQNPDTRHADQKAEFVSPSAPFMGVKRGVFDFGDRVPMPPIERRLRIGFNEIDVSPVSHQINVAKIYAENQAFPIPQISSKFGTADIIIAGQHDWRRGIFFDDVDVASTKPTINMSRLFESQGIMNKFDLSGGTANIFDLISDTQEPLWSIQPFKILVDDLHHQIRALDRIDDSLGDLVRLAAQGQRPNYKDCSDATQNSRKPRRAYLFFGGVSSPYLGIQITCLAFAAFGFSALSGLSLFRAFDNGDNKWIWLPVALVSALSGLFLWGWAWAGNPLSAWGLAP